MSGDNETALRYAEETVALVRPSSVPSIVGLSLRTLGDVLRVRGDLEGARAALSESLELVLGKASRTQIVFNLESSADVAAAAGDAERAARLYGAVEAIRRELGVLPAPGFQLLREPMLACARSALGDTFDKVTNEGRAMSFDDAVAYALGKDPDSQEKS
jgi:non-specific serine/threonine protein kinase